MARRPVWIAFMVLILVGMACRTTSPTERTPEPAQTSGEQIFQRLGCSGCHSEADGVAPSLHDIYGEEVNLESGETVTADEEYLRESILSPNAKIVHGYPAIMPDYQKRLNEEEVDALVGYIRTLRD